ncbi:MAG: major capsid protein [Myroides sp.]
MIINANNIVPEFSQANMSAIINAYTLGDLRYREFFPLQYNTDLTYSNLEATTSAKVMADIVAIGSKAPRKGRDFVAAVKGEMPKIEIARDLDEHDLIKIQQLRNAVQLNPNNQAIKNQMIDKIYGDSEFVLDGVNARLEYVAKSLVSTGKYKTTVTDNSGGVADVSVDFKVVVTPASKDWFVDVDADPMKDIQTAQNAALAKGYRFSTITMDQATANRIIEIKSVQEFVYGVANNGGTTQMFRPTLEMVNARLALYGLPTIRIWETFVNAESKSGVLTTTNGWQAGNVLLSVSPNLGNTQYTTTPEFSMNFGTTTAQTVADGFVLVKTFGVQDPILVSTKATAFALPVLNDTKKNVILKTKLA